MSAVLRVDRETCSFSISALICMGDTGYGRVQRSMIWTRSSAWGGTKAIEPARYVKKQQKKHFFRRFPNLFGV